MFQGFVELAGTLRLMTQARDADHAVVQADALPTYRVFGASGALSGQSGSMSQLESGNVTGASNATPIVITSADHNLATGARVTVAAVEGNTAANGTWTVTRINGSTFSLDGSVGNGAYTTGGTWKTTGLYYTDIVASGANGYASGQTYTVIVSYLVAASPKAEEHSFVVA